MSRTEPMSKRAGISFGALEASIADRIFDILAPKKLAPHKRLVPLLRINKHWHTLAARRMYTSISVKGQWISRPLRKTLEANGALAALVTELVLDTELSAQDPHETRDHIRIVAACPNLQSLTVLGYAPNDVDSYRAAIGSRFSLEALNISEGAGMFTPSQLLDMLSSWPKLEKLVLKDALLPASESGNASSKAKAKSPSRIPCKTLKMAKLLDDFNPATQFSFPDFATLTPCLAVLWVEPHGAMPLDLKDGLSLWAPTLETLCALSETELHLETVLPQFTRLKHIDTWSQMLSPRSVQHIPPTVQMLTYRIFPAQLLDLSETLFSSTVASSLKAVTIKGAIPPGKQTPMQFTPTAIQSVKTVCRQRRIRLTI
ncbi:unnamed protein product [Mycena citricolor]|uniref:Uncharacterized protein n=1 Tax=Mycena citricolor TaxID=2018698 RepID=A0AAD2K4E8_9AGAR|nr:unnamed protein product [Mycena citricolor]